MNKRYEKISIINFQVIDKPKRNICSYDFDLEENNYYLKHFKTEFNKDIYYNINNDGIKGNIFGNKKLNNIKKDMKNLKNEIKNLNILAHKNIKKEFNIYQRTINPNIKKNDLNNYNYLCTSAKKRKIRKKNNFDYIYLSPDNKEKYGFKINYYKRIFNDNNFYNKNILNRKLNNINLYKKKIEFKEMNKNIIKKEKKNVKNKIEFNNQNVKHQIIIINNNNNNKEEEKQIKKIEKDKNNYFEENNIKNEQKEEEEKYSEKLLINDEELNIPLIIETLKYNKVLLEKKEENNIVKLDNDKEKKEKGDFKIDNNYNINKGENNDNFLMNKNLFKDNLKLNNQEEFIDIIDNKNKMNIIQNEDDNKNKIDEENKEINKTDDNLPIEEINLIKNKDNKKEVINYETNCPKDDVDKIILNENNKYGNENIMNENKEITNNNNKLKEEENQLIELTNEEIINKIIIKIQKPKKSRKDLHIKINEENNIIIGFVPKDLITEYEILKDSQELLDKTSPINHSFSVNQKILTQKLILCPSIKNFNKKEIKVDSNYTLRENMEEKDIIPGLCNENEEDIKNLEKSLEKSIDKSFDRSYDKSINNNSLNQSDNQNLSQSNNQSLSYNDVSLNASRNSTSEGNAIMQQLHKLLSGSILSTNIEVEEEKEEDNSINKEKDEDKKQENSKEDINKDEDDNESLSSNKDEKSENNKGMNNSS